MLVFSAVIGILASAVVGIVFTLGQLETRGADRSAFGLFVLPFAVSMVIGGGIHKALIHRGRRTKRTS